MLSSADLTPDGVILRESIEMELASAVPSNLLGQRHLFYPSLISTSYQFQSIAPGGEMCRVIVTYETSHSPLYDLAELVKECCNAENNQTIP